MKCRSLFKTLPWNGASMHSFKKCPFTWLLIWYEIFIIKKLFMNIFTLVHFLLIFPLRLKRNKCKVVNNACPFTPFLLRFSRRPKLQRSNNVTTRDLLNGKAHFFYRHTPQKSNTFLLLRLGIILRSKTSACGFPYLGRCINLGLEPCCPFTWCGAATILYLITLTWVIVRPCVRADGLCTVSVTSHPSKPAWSFPRRVQAYLCPCSSVVFVWKKD